MIRTSLSCREARALQRLAQGRRVVEAGALLGASAVILSQTAAHVTSIDKHQGYGPSTLQTYFSNLDIYATRRNIQSIVGDVLDFLPTVEADFTFLDLTGEYDLTFHSLQVVTSPLVAVHDLHRVGCEGVERAILDAGFRITSQVDSLAICERRVK